MQYKNILFSPFSLRPELLMTRHTHAESKKVVIRRCLHELDWRPGLPGALYNLDWHELMIPQGTKRPSVDALANNSVTLRKRVDKFVGKYYASDNLLCKICSKFV